MYQGRMAAAAYKHPDGDGSVLIIAEGSDKEGQQNFAKRTSGASTVEAVDLKDLTGFAKSYKPGSAGCLDQLLAFGAVVMTKVDPDGMRTRLKALSGTRATKEATAAERAAQAYVAQPSLDAAHRLLRALGKNPGARAYRPAIYYGALDALSTVAESGKSFADAAISGRELQRHKVRVLPKRAVGSTLLLKGLEGDVAVVMHPEKMTATHLYVGCAYTRCKEGPGVLSEVGADSPESEEGLGLVASGEVAGSTCLAGENARLSKGRTLSAGRGG